MLVSFTSINAIDPAPPTDDKTEKKEIIIVQIDEDLSAQISALADYAYQIYHNLDRGVIKITTYTDLNQESSVSELLALLDDKGVTKNDIIIEKKGLELDQAYFTISVAEGPAVQ